MYKHIFNTPNERKFSKEEGMAETNDHYGVAFFIFTLAFLAVKAHSKLDANNNC